MAHAEDSLSNSSFQSVSPQAEDSQDEMDHNSNGECEAQLQIEDHVLVTAGQEDDEVYNPPTETTPMASPARDKTYMYDPDNLIAEGGRRARRNRGTLRPDDHFAFVSTLKGGDQVSKKRR